MDDLQLAFDASRKDSAPPAPAPETPRSQDRVNPDRSNPEFDAVNELLEEIESAEAPMLELPEPGGGDCYLGSIVIQKHSDGVSELFDGLQRTCALTILIGVLRDMIRQNRGVSDRLHSLIVDQTGEPRLRLIGKTNLLAPNIQQRGATTAFAERFEAQFAEADLDRDAEREADLETRFAEAVDVFRRRLDQWLVGKRIEFADFLLSRVFLTVVTMQTESLAQRAFVTTNDRGLALRQVELLKGVITDICESEEDVQKVVRHWTGVQNTIDQFGDLEDFLKIVDFMERGEPQRENCLMRLGAHLEVSCGPGGIVGWMVNLGRLAVSWRELSLRLRKKTSDPVDASIRRLGVFKFQEWRPLALYWYDRYRQLGAEDSRNANHIRRIERQFALLHRRCLLVQLLHADNKPTREKIFHYAQRHKDWELAQPLHALNASEGDRRKFRTALTQPLLNSQSRRVLVLWLEAERQGADFSEDLAAATVEHILPQNPPHGSPWRALFADDQQRYLSCHSFGNLAAVGQDNLGTQSFAQKRRSYSLQAETFQTLREAVESAEWNKERIEAVRDARIEEVIAALHWPEQPRPVANGAA